MSYAFMGQYETGHLQGSMQGSSQNHDNHSKLSHLTHVQSIRTISLLS